MKIKNIKDNKVSARQSQYARGFTLIETMVAIFILTISLTAFFGVVASSLFSARYANNEITATYLLQEAADSIRNDRDTMQEVNSGNTGWINLQTKYSACFTNAGCEVEPQANTVNACPTAGSGSFGSINCALFNYDPDALNNDFYTYKSAGAPSKFKRQVKMTVNSTNSDEIDMKVTVEWQNGNLTRTQSLVTSLLNWRKNL